MWDETNTKLAGVGPHFFVHYKGWKQTCVCRYSCISPCSFSPFVCACCFVFFVALWPWFRMEARDMDLRLILAYFFTDGTNGFP
ncbi:hypothetical protein L210DRAFT_3540830 [Boletus edulis BED1]|uniref:Uncharacterized protein n=1 Tax=Boletus edulis BED1 TaxID=1328754 RepID=A0AAD4BD68_BOLED|nr:hypothetical protein L210DRAFT_3576304 [Boletus edulis BED1]KAF8439893.1 hypothetical protein L210DRAFT_3540830 [Boletus edulis BED1]